MLRFLSLLVFVLALSATALHAQTAPATKEVAEEPELGTPEWLEANLTTITLTSVGIRSGGKGFANLNTALRAAGYAGVEPTLWSVNTGTNTLVKNQLYFGFEAQVLFGQVRERGGYESYVPVFEVPLSSVALQLNLGYNVLNGKSQALRLIPAVGVGWGLTRVTVEPTASLLGPSTFAGSLAAPPPSLRLRQTYWYAQPQLIVQWLPQLSKRPELKSAFVIEARVGYLVAGDRPWNDRYDRLTDAPSDNPSALTFSLGFGFNLRGRPRNAMSEAMESGKKK
jgi:hypothetical protein